MLSVTARNGLMMMLTVYCSFSSIAAVSQSQTDSVDCNLLLLGQYFCYPPHIDLTTQSIANCRLIDEESGLYQASVSCYTAPGLSCDGKSANKNTSIVFEKEIPCTPVDGKSFKTALLLSIFLGMFGVDRFYLGYPALGLLKLSTFGFMLIGQLIDIVLIATQMVKPAGGTDYIMDFYGPALSSAANMSFPLR